MRRSLTSRSASGAIRFSATHQQQHPQQQLLQEHRNFHLSSYAATTRVVPAIFQERFLFPSSCSSSMTCASSAPLVPQTPTMTTLSFPPHHDHVARQRASTLLMTTTIGCSHRSADQIKSKRGLRTDTGAAAVGSTDSRNNNDDNEGKEDEIVFWYDRTDHVIGEALFGSINVLEATACLHYWLNKEEENKNKQQQQHRRGSNSSSVDANKTTTTHLCSTALHYIFGLVERLHAVEWIIVSSSPEQQQRRRGKNSKSNTNPRFLTLQDLHQIVELWHDAEVRMHHFVLHSNQQQDDQGERFTSGNDSYFYSAPPLELVSILPTAGRLLEQVEDVAQRLIALGAITATSATATSADFSRNNNNYEKNTASINHGAWLHNANKQPQQVSLSIELYNFLIDSAVRASQGEEILRHLLNGRPSKTRASTTTSTICTTTTTTTTTTTQLLEDFRLDQENSQKQQSQQQSVDVFTSFTLPRPNLQSFLLVIMGYRNTAPTDPSAADKALHVLFDLLQQPDIQWKHPNTNSSSRRSSTTALAPQHPSIDENAADWPFRLVVDVWLKTDRSDSVEKCRQVLEVMRDADITVKASHFKPILDYCLEKEGLLHEQARELELAMQECHDAADSSAISVEETTTLAVNNEIREDRDK